MRHERKKILSVSAKNKCLSPKGVFGETATVEWRLKKEVCVMLTLQQNVSNKACSYDEYGLFAPSPNPHRHTRQFRDRLVWSRKVWRYWRSLYSKVPIIRFDPMINMDRLHLVRTPGTHQAVQGEVGLE